MLSINISLTGHRDINPDKKSEYEEKIKQILLGLMNEYKHTKINLLCGMAEGADILAANIVLKLKEEFENRFGLIAVLPMNKEEFVTTFYEKTKQQSTDEFERVFLKVDKIYDLSKVYEDSNINGNPYERLGIFLTDNSQALIALWNGVNKQAVGGTSSVVECALKGKPHEYRGRFSIIDADDTIPVYHIPVERISTDEASAPIEYIESAKSWGTILYPKIWESMDACKTDVETYYNNILQEIDAFNSNVLKYSPKGNSHLLDDDCMVSVEDVKKSHGMKEIIDHQVSSGVLVSKYQKKTWKFMRLQLFLGLISFLWVALYDEILSNCGKISEGTAPFILLLVPISIVACIWVYRYVNRKRIESRYYDYRAMSENLRVQFYWKLTGLKNNTFNNYSRKNEWELGWVLAAIRNISMDINYELCSNQKNRNYQELKLCWINGQINYFKTKCQKNKKRIKWNTVVKYAMFGAGVLAAMLLMIQAKWEAIGIEEFAFLFAVDFFLSVGAVFYNYFEQRKFDVELNQYRRMIMIFTQAKVEFEKAYAENDYDKLDKIIVEIGYDALAENADWVVFNRMSSIDIPMG